MLEDAKLQPEAEKMLDQATVTEQVAVKAEQVAQAARPNELAQSRGASGSLSSLRTVWVGEVISIESLDLNALRFHISQDALQKAVNSFVKAGGRKIHGAKIYEESSVVTR